MSPWPQRAAEARPAAAKPAVIIELPRLNRGLVDEILNRNGLSF